MINLRKVRINALAYSILIKHLLDGGYTLQELSEATGISTRTISDYIKHLRKAQAAYISGYQTDNNGRHQVVQFSLGEKMDVAKPKPMTSAQKCQRYRDKKAKMTMMQRIGL